MQHREKLPIVKRYLTIRYLLASVAWLGLVLAPLATPAVAMAMSMSMEMAATSIHAASMEMPEGMPCCPEPTKPDCAKDCPFMAAVCSGITFPPIADGAILSAPTTLLAVIAPSDDAKRSGLAQGPPARPPKA